MLGFLSDWARVSLGLGQWPFGPGSLQGGLGRLSLGQKLGLSRSGADGVGSGIGVWAS